ncbi:MAG: hypothetical protein BMS9Abin12_1721 [Acidimicrobiia bacterium]|nr:MAG: hypothetical protein BMS9Abin12_1721 [Acidimicrobiia bacterium]
MNGKERIALAMRNEVPDRVPVMCQLSWGHYMLNTDVPPHVMYFSSEAFAQALVDLQRRYRFDGILIDMTGRPDDLLDRVASIEQTDDGEKLTWETGEISFHPWDDSPQHYPGDSGRKEFFDFAVDEPDDLDRIDELVRGCWCMYHMPFALGKADAAPMTEVPPYMFNTIDRVLELVDGEVSVHGEVFSPFTLLMLITGYEDALMGLLTDPVKAHALLERLTVPAITWAVAQAQRGCDAVLLSSPFAGGPFLSPKMYKEFVIPYEKRVTDAIHAQGVVAYTHTCGGIGDRLDLMIETGTAGIDTLDPPPLGNVELADAKAQVGDKVFLKGNMNSVELLQATTERDVVAHATDRISIGKPGGGYILSTACSVAPHTEPWKLEMLTPLAEEIGRYE